jgi:hypothetical protein
VQKLDYKALILRNWAFNYLKYPVRNVLRYCPRIFVEELNEIRKTAVRIAAPP